ncbi:hypothetical protein B0H13DRAFT_1892844 [Mycena leptocephala]|nr:hypothetical protein B0H13DRAFT_1892844 [Mycena leptocephala]
MSNYSYSAVNNPPNASSSCQSNTDDPINFDPRRGDVVVHPFSTQDLLAEYLMDNPDTEGQDPVKDMENLHPRYFLRSMRNAFPAGIPQPTTAKAPGPSKLTPAEMKY